MRLKLPYDATHVRWNQKVRIYKCLAFSFPLRNPMQFALNLSPCPASKCTSEGKLSAIPGLPGCDGAEKRSLGEFPVYYNPRSIRTTCSHRYPGTCMLFETIVLWFAL